MALFKERRRLARQKDAMPKVDGLDKSIRVAMLADELSDGADPTDIPIVTPVTPTPAPPVAAAPPVASMDTAALIQLLASTLNQSGVTQAQAIKDALADATTMAREPIPENKVAPGVSVYSHPEGDLAHPRTPLRCPMFLGVYDEDGKATPAFEIFQDTSTEAERQLLNRLEPGEIRVERNDGVSAICRVVEKRDDLGQPLRLVIAVPQTWLHKDQQQAMPALVRRHGDGLLQQLTSGAA